MSPAMGPGRWQHLKALFDQAASQPPAERASLLARLRTDEPELAAELESLLAAHDARTLVDDDSPLADAHRLLPPETPLLHPGETIMRRFQILRCLGRGGMGEVYEAEDRVMGRIAIKIIRPEIVRRSDIAARFQTEAQSARRITTPFVCRIHEFLTAPAENGRPEMAFLTMEFLDGCTLWDRIERDGPFKPKDAEALAVQLCRGLQAIHDAGVVHRDLKARNIMLVQRQSTLCPVIMDFGLARRTLSPGTPTASSSDPGIVIGTPEYMAPEQFEGREVTRTADIYALGIVLYEMVVGKHPFEAATPLGVAVRRAKRPPSACSVHPEFPRRWDRVIERCLEYDSDRRFPSANEVALALNQRASGITHLPKAAAVASLHRPWNWISLLVLLACAAGIVILLSQRPQPHPAEAVRWFNDGVDALRDGTYLKAVKALKQAIAIDTNFPLAHARLADAYNELDYSGEAKDELLLASASAASDLPKLDKKYLQAIRATVLHDFPAAVKEYRSIMIALPSAAKADGYVDLGRAYEKVGDLPHAVDNYSAATKAAPDNPAAFVRIGVLEGRQNRMAEAESSFAVAEKQYQAASNYEGIAEVEYERGDMAAANWDWKQANELLGQALTFAHDYSPQLEARTLCRLSAVEHASRNDVQAEKWALKALSTAHAEGLSYWEAEAQCRLSNAYTYPWIDPKTGKSYSRLHEATSYAQAVLQAAKRNRWPLIAAESEFALALIWSNDDRVPISQTLSFSQAALDYYRQAGYFTDSTRALILMIRTEREIADFHAALILCRQGLELESKSGSPRVMIQMEEAAGTVYLATETYPDALRHFEAAAAIARQNGSNLIGYEMAHVADALWRLGDYSKADQELNSLTVNTSTDHYLASSVTLALAEMRLSQGRYQEAISAAARSQALDPRLPSAELDALAAVAYLRCGSPKKALALATQALGEAQSGSNEDLLAGVKLAAAEVYLNTSSPTQAKSLAESALATYSKFGQPESKWRALALLSKIYARSNDRTAAASYASKSLDIVSALKDNWGQSFCKLYLTRPDVSALLRELHTRMQ